MEQKKPNGLALLPIIIFLIVYLGSGIYYEYINPVEGGMGFYVTSVVVAFMIALAVAFVQNKELPFDEKITACAKGIGDDNITIMLFIFLLAGPVHHRLHHLDGDGNLLRNDHSTGPDRYKRGRNRAPEPAALHRHHCRRRYVRRQPFLYQ